MKRRDGFRTLPKTLLRYRILRLMPQDSAQAIASVLQTAVGMTVTIEPYDQEIHAYRGYASKF